jgi:uncharacterized protein YggU (UPF0235/DUF167 family)
VANVVVRVVPGSAAPGAVRDRRGLVLRVRAAAERGRATEEARRLLAAVLGVPPASVRLRGGATTRTKRFEVLGLAREELDRRLSALGGEAR